MASRIVLVVPDDGKKSREYRLAMRIFLPLLVLLLLGAAGFILTSLGIKPDSRIAEKAKTLESENKMLRSQHNTFEKHFSKLKNLIRELKIHELDVRVSAGLVQRKKETADKKDLNLFSFVRVPLRSVSPDPIDTLLASAGHSKAYLDLLIGKIVEDPDGFERIPSIWPLGSEYTFISFPFGERLNPFTGRIMPHAATDFPAPDGTPVFAAARGTVQIVENHKFFGNRVRISHANSFSTVYAHLKKAVVWNGQMVRKGQMIGTVGSSGYSIGPHLHYEVLQKDIPVNPEVYLMVPTQKNRIL